MRPPLCSQQPRLAAPGLKVSVLDRWPHQGTSPRLSPLAPPAPGWGPKVLHYPWRPPCPAHISIHGPQLSLTEPGPGSLGPSPPPTWQGAGAGGIPAGPRKWGPLGSALPQVTPAQRSLSSPPAAQAQTPGRRAAAPLGNCTLSPSQFPQVGKGPQCGCRAWPCSGRHLPSAHHEGHAQDCVWKGTLRG